MSHPPYKASKSPKVLWVLAPLLGDSQGHFIWVCWSGLAGSKWGPASTTAIFKPASESIFVAIPPPAPEPTITASYILEDSFICIVGYSSWLYTNNIMQKIVK